MQYPKLVESKTSANELSMLEWNPGMDLLATVFKNGALTCSRLLSLQKVWHKQSSGKTVSATWRSDGRVLAIGAYNDKTKEHICTLHDVENGKEIYSITKDRAITSVSWFQYFSEQDEKETEEQACFRKLMSPAANENFSHQLAHEQTQLNILVISTEDGRVSFYALGLFYLGDIVVHTDSTSRVLKTNMSGCLEFITATIATKHLNSTLSSVKVLKLSTLHERSNEILKVSKMYARITDELEYLDDTISAMTTSWADVLAGLDNKLSSYCSRKRRNLDDSSDGYTFLSADELLQLLVIGFPSNNLEKFLTDMSDKGLKKLNNAIEQTCLRVQNLIVKNAQKCCYHLHADLNLLRGMSLWREKFRDVGLDDKFIVEAMRSVGAFMLKLTELQQVIDHSLKSTKSFFRWLISIACRMTGEQNNSVVPSDINKTTQQDIQLITDFILENFDYNQDDFDVAANISEGEANGETSMARRPTCSNFTLEQVGQYLKNDSLSRLKYSFARPNSNFWIEFFKQHPEISDTNHRDEDGSSVILFYPHNPETSLLQEHKKTCGSIGAAFEFVAANIKFLTEGSDNFIHLKDFVRNGPTNRIRTETDVRSMQHYTLFQTKPDLVTRQYLISQSLDDKKFKLISIEFQSIGCPPGSSSRTSSSAASSGLMISDSDFYENSETRKMLVSFLLIDQALGDTVIVQVELIKLMESADAAERYPKETSKIFRSNDSIDRNSTQVVLKLDLYTEPASERKHEPLMMVKKIKSTVGKDLYSSSGRGVIAFTSCGNKRLHLYELESSFCGPEIMDDQVEGDDKVDESLIDTDLMS